MHVNKGIDYALVENKASGRRVWDQADIPVNMGIFVNLSEIGWIEKQSKFKSHIAGMGCTDLSDCKNRGYFHLICAGTPDGILLDVPVNKPKAWAEDEYLTQKKRANYDLAAVRTGQRREHCPNWQVGLMSTQP